MMRPARSRRVLAQRKFAQGAYVPPSAAPAPPTNSNRRDNNPSGRNFIIQHQVGPSVFVDYISHQALELHHKGLQPFVMVTRLEVPPSQGNRAKKTEINKNRELIRNRELDRIRNLDKKTREKLQTTATRESTRNKESNKSKNIATNKDKNNENTTVKDSSKKNNLRNSLKPLKEMVKSKDCSNEKDIIKKKDVSKNKLNKTKEKTNSSTNKSNREKPPPIKKPKPTKPMHVMSLRSRRHSKQEFSKITVETRATKRLTVATRKVAKALQEKMDTAQQEKSKQKSTDPLKTGKGGSISEFSVDDNKPLTYFVKCSTPKRAPVAAVPRVALVPLASATPATNTTTETTAKAAPEPVAGPSGSNKKKVNKTSTPKTSTNPYVLLPNIAPAPVPAQTSSETQTSPTDPPFYSTPPNIYQWMNKSFDDELGLLKGVASKSAPWAAVQPSCPALRWHTVKELNNADKAQLEARCLKCSACMRIDKLMKLSETLKSQVNFDVSGDENADTAEPNIQEEVVSSDGTIYMELLPKMANKLMKIRTHNVLGRNMLSACLIPRAHAQQTKDLSLVEQEGLLEQINATLTASAQAAERSGRPIMESSSDTDSTAIVESGTKVRFALKTKRKRRQSLCADLAMQPQPQRKRRQSVCAELASQQQEEEQQKSDVAMQPRPQRKRRKSVCAELAMQEQEEQQRREMAIKEQQEKQNREAKEKEELRKDIIKMLQEQRQREIALKEREEQHRREYAQRQQQEHQRRESEKQQEQQRHAAEMLRHQEPQWYSFQTTEAQQTRQNRDIAYLSKAVQAGPRQRVRETESGEFVIEDRCTPSSTRTEENVQPQTQQRQRRRSVSAELAAKELHEQQQSKSVPEVKVQPQRQRRQSVSAEVAFSQHHEQRQRKSAPEVKVQPQRQRRQSVSAELAAKQQHEQLQPKSVPEVKEQPQRQRRQSVSAELATKQQLEQLQPKSVPEAKVKPQRQRRQSVSAEMAFSQHHEQRQRKSAPEVKVKPQRQRRQSVSAELAAKQQHEQLQPKSVPEVKEQPQRQRRQSVSAELATKQQLEQLQPKSVPEVKVQPQRQRRQSVSAELAARQQNEQLQPKSVPEVKEQPQRQRRQSVSAELATKQQLEQLQPKSVPEVKVQPQRQRRQSVSAELAARQQNEQLQHESDSSTTTTRSVSKEKVQAQPQQQQSGSAELSMQQRRQRRQSVCARLAEEDLVVNDSDDEPIIQTKYPIITISNDELCKVIDEVTVDFDPRQIQMSTPIANYTEHDRPTESENCDEYVIEQPHHEQTAEPMAGNDEFSLGNEYDSLLHDTKDIFQSEGESSQQEQVAGPASRDSPGMVGGSARSSFNLVYEDSVNGDAASEARMMAEVDEQARALEKEKDAKGDNGPDKGHSSGTDPNASSGFPNSADTARIVDAPVFHPTLEEFDDPIAYFEAIMPIAAKYGICKVVPPEGWEPKCKINEEIRFDVTNQYISRLFCRWGPASRELSALKLCLQLQNVNVTRPPLVDGVEVNLPKLYHLVQRHGGLENVINKKRWGKVAEEMRLNKAPVIERKLDQLYVKYLLPYATLDHNERQEIMKKVEMAWHHKSQKLLDRATNPLHRQKRMLGESESSDGETEDEGTANALADAEDCVVPGLCMNFAKFKKVATNAYENLMGIERPDADMPSVEIIEDRYWRLIVMGTEHLCVNTAAIDTGEEGHGFTKNKNDYYGRHPWNLKMFSQNRGNILRYLGPVLGMTVPTLHLAMIYSTSCWHKDPHALPWTEFMHNGPERIWYGIPDDQSDNFRKAVETLSPTSCQNKSLWLPTDIAMIPPSLLREHNVSLSRTVQEPNEFVLVFPKAYSCSISTGYTESESVYFAPRSWLDNIEQVIKETRESCEPTMFSLEQLIIQMCQDPEADDDLIKQVKPVLDKIVSEELSYRQQLEEKGLKFVDERDMPSTSSRKRNASAYNVRDQDECEYCRATLYLSKVRGLTGKKSSVCLEHALLLLNNPKYKDVNVGQLEVFVYMTVEELNDVTASVEARVGPSS